MEFTLHHVKQRLPVNQWFTSQEPTDPNQLLVETLFNGHLGTEGSVLAKKESLWRRIEKGSVLR